MPQPDEAAPHTDCASRLPYSVALIGALLGSGFALGGWVAIATGAGGAGRTTVLLLAVSVLARLVWVWRTPRSLALPEPPALRRTAVWALRMALVGTVAYAATLGSGFFIRELPQDTRGAVGLVVGLVMLPVVTLAPLGLVVFEAARGWHLRSGVPASARSLLRTAMIVAALAVCTPWLSATLLRYPDVRALAEFAALGYWPLLALGAGFLVVQAEGVEFPTGAVFGTALCSALATSVALTVFGPLLQGWQLLGVAAGLLFNPFAIVASLGGNATTGIVIALPLALVPAVANHVLARHAARTQAAVSAMPLVAGVVGALAVFCLGLLTSAPRVAAQATRFRMTAVSSEQRAVQERLLRPRCATAGSRVFRSVAGVTAIEVVFPEPFPPDYKRFPPIPTAPEPGRPHDWFPRGPQPAPGYESVVFSFGGQRRGYVRDPSYAGGHRDVDAATIPASFVMRVQRLDTAEEAAAGVAGVEFTVHAIGDETEIARHRLFFKKVQGDYGYREACGTLPANAFTDAYAFKWLSQVLIPTSTTAAPGQGRESGNLSSSFSR